MADNPPLLFGWRLGVWRDALFLAPAVLALLVVVVAAGRLARRPSRP